MHNWPYTGWLPTVTVYGVEFWTDIGLLVFALRWDLYVLDHIYNVLAIAPAGQRALEPDLATFWRIADSIHPAYSLQLQLDLLVDTGHLENQGCSSVPIPRREREAGLSSPRGGDHSVSF